MPEAERRARILIAENDGSLRNSLRQFLSDVHAWIVCGEAASGGEAVRMVLRVKPDVVVLDLRMPELGGFEAAAHIRRSAPDTKIVIFTADETPVSLARAARLGIEGYVAKGADCVARLPEAIHTVLGGGKSFPPTHGSARSRNAEG